MNWNFLNISRNVPNFRKLYSEINPEINELSGDIFLVAQYFVKRRDICMRWKWITILIHCSALLKGIQLSFIVVEFRWEKVQVFLKRCQCRSHRCYIRADFGYFRAVADIGNYANLVQFSFGMLENIIKNNFSQIASTTMDQKREILGKNFSLIKCLNLCFFLSKSNVLCLFKRYFRKN
jgi:hypothetical protein